MNRPIFLVTDFGARDSYVGQMKAIIAGIAPGARVFDLTHEIEPFSVEEGAWTLDITLDALPLNAIVVAVVDPGVGTTRRPILVEAEGRGFLGPDNGLLSVALPAEIRDELEGATEVEGIGAILAVRELSSPQYRRPNVSATFHGRDIFAPAAAHLAAGLDSRLLGPPTNQMIAIPTFSGRPGQFGELHGHIIHIDRFGNLITTIRAAQLFPGFCLSINNIEVDTRVHTFGNAPAGVPFCYADSAGFVAVGMNRASAAVRLDVKRHDRVLVACR